MLKHSPPTAGDMEREPDEELFGDPIGRIDCDCGGGTGG